jgi:hypothetical protein
MQRTVFFQDHSGQHYRAVERVKGAILTDPLVIHSGLPGFLGPEIIPPSVQLVARRQVFKVSDDERA